MRANVGVVLDACVLLPMPLADTLLRLAETPSLYLPRWTDEIMHEVSRNLVSKWNKSEDQARYRERQLRRAFPEAWVDESYRKLTGLMTNETKDRHVLAAAVRSNSAMIVTFNKRDFARSATEPWNVEVKGPSTFLRELYDLDPAIVLRKLVQQSESLHEPFDELLKRLHGSVPGFVDFLRDRQGIGL